MREIGSDTNFGVFPKLSAMAGAAGIYLPA